eukprot:ANDGO_00076.mRNA.1 Fatty acyl-CoA synthetase A
MFEYEKGRHVDGQDVDSGEKNEIAHQSFSDVERRVRDIGSGLLHAKVLSKGDYVGIISRTMCEWQLAAFASDYCGGVLVPMYDSSAADKIQYILDKVPFSLLFSSVSNLKNLAEALQASEASRQNLRCVVVLEELYHNFPESMRSLFRSFDIKLFSLSEVERLGRETGVLEATPLGPTDVCTMIQTSGTTKNPRLVPFTGPGMLSAVSGALLALQDSGFVFQEDDSYLAYLPLAHVFERAVELAAVLSGIRVSYFSGDVKDFARNVAQFKPSLLCGVPRIWNRVYEQIMREASSNPFQKFIFAQMCSLNRLARRTKLDAIFPSRLLFGKARRVFGGRLRLLMSSSALLRPEVASVLSIVLAPLVQIYGSTETGGAGLITSVKRNLHDASSLGFPLPGCEVCLQSVPDLGYSVSSNPPSGELLVRGPSVSKGYFQDPKSTAEDFLPDGWFRTGDIFHKNRDGSFSIIDRRKNFVKTSHGEFVALEHVESVLVKSDLVENIWVHVDSSQPFSVAIVLADESRLQKAVSSSGSLSDKSSSEDVAADTVLKDIERVGREHGLRGFEIPKKVYVETKVKWSSENDFLTPTMKKKRTKFRDAYGSTIREMYSEA